MCVVGVVWRNGDERRVGKQNRKARDVRLMLRLTLDGERWPPLGAEIVDSQSRLGREQVELASAWVAADGGALDVGQVQSIAAHRRSLRAGVQRRHERDRDGDASVHG